MTSSALVSARADVYCGDVLAGHISRTAKGSVFEYVPEFARQHDRGIARHLPLSVGRSETFGVNLHTYFAGLLPEGVRFIALAARLKTSRDDLLSMLIAAGGDCIGEVAVTPEGRSPQDPSPAADIAHIDGVSFEELFEASLRFPGLEGGGEVSIPGVQRKVSAAMIGFPLRARHRRHAYILKLTQAELPRLVENEAFVMRAAANCGLRVAETEIVHDREGHSGLLVKRFDRVPAQRGRVTLKVYQEDACQLLDRYPADKYLLSFAEVAEMIHEVASAPIVELAKLLRMHAFSYLVANGDLHAKNISLCRPPGTSRIELTPCYDLLSTLPYGDRTMALRMEGRDDNLRRSHFVAFGERFGVRPRAVESMLDELCDCLVPWIERVGEIGLEPRKTADLERVMRKRREDLGRR